MDETTREPERDTGGDQRGQETHGEGDGGSGEGEPTGRAGRAWSGWSGLWELQENVSEMVDSALRGLTPQGGRFPRHDLIRLSDGGYRILFDLPGVAREDLEVTTVGDELTVSGERHRPELPEGAEPLRSERGFGRFRRSVRMPPDVDGSAVRARLEHGVLEISLPRRGDSEAQTIEVEG